jgi:hypothetical protein
MRVTGSLAASAKKARRFDSCPSAHSDVEFSQVAKSLDQARSCIETMPQPELLAAVGG